MNKKYSHRFRFNAVLAIAILGLTTNSFADDPDKLPTSEMVMKKYVEASGGAEKLKAIKSVKMTGDIESKTMGISGSLEISIVAPNMVSEKADMPEVGIQARGTNGKVAWENSTMLGPRVIKGKEMELMLEQANFERIYAADKFYKEIKVLGIEEMNDEKCYKVEMTRKNGHKSIDFFSLKTGLPTASKFRLPTQMGEVDITSMTVEYKEVNGVKFPSKIEQLFPGGMSMTVMMKNIELNAEIDKSTFDVPKEVKTLVDGSTDG